VSRAHLKTNQGVYVPVHDIAKELNITREEIYAKYTGNPLSENF